MSLIIEALKKARDDALRRQAAARGLPLAPVPKLERKSRWLTFALIPLVAALVICVMLLVDVYSRIPRSSLDQEQPFSPSSNQELNAGAEADSSETTFNESSSVPVEVAAAGSLPPASGSGERSTLGAPSPSRADSPAVSARSTSPGADPAAQPSVATPSPSAPAIADDSKDRVSTGQAQLSTGQIVDLGGIAWSESDPYALINGQVVGVGELVRSYRVISITPNEVTLEKDEDRVILRLE